MYGNFIVYGVRLGKWKTAVRNNPLRINAGVVCTAAVVAAVSTTCHLVCSLVTYNLGYHDHSPMNCEIALGIWSFTYIAAIMSVYFFLWFRQRSFYQHPAMNGFRTTLLKCSIVVVVTG